MRTKALLLGAMIGAASLATSMAQVYSQNIVGYVNITIPNGFAIIQNPLNASPDNSLASVLPNPGRSVAVYKYNGVGGFFINTYDTDFGWDDSAMLVAPGEAFFIYNQGTSFSLTFVGEVATGHTSISLISGFNMIGSKVPQAGLLQTDLGYTPASGGETVYMYNGHGYDMYNFDRDFGWDVEPTIAVGTGFWAFRSSAGSWDRDFNVGP